MLLGCTKSGSRQIRLGRTPYTRQILRCYSSNPERTLDTWINGVSTAEQRYEDHISVEKVQDLYCTLPTRAGPLPTIHDPLNALLYDKKPGADAILRPCHTLIFFHPRTPEALLGPDQTDTDFCPPPPFTRRMWAGGAFRWHGETNADSLRMGRQAIATATVAKVEKKGFEKGSPMIFVHQDIKYKHQVKGPVLMSEERIHVYLPRDVLANKRLVRQVPDLPKPDYTFSWTPTPTTLFRFSALTWNAHLIHLDPEYARNEEGYPERLVHGPLTALMLIEALYNTGYKGRINNFEYRARNPVLVNRRQHVRGALSTKRDKATIWAEDDDGVVGMTGTVDLLDPSLFKFSSLAKPTVGFK